MVDVHKGTGDALTCGSYRAKNLLEHVMTSHNLYPPLPLSQTVTLSQTPSPLWSVTYFMDGPKYVRPETN